MPTGRPPRRDGSLAGSIKFRIVVAEEERRLAAPSVAPSFRSERLRALGSASRRFCSALERRPPAPWARHWSSSEPVRERLSISVASGVELEADEAPDGFGDHLVERWPGEVGPIDPQ